MYPALMIDDRFPDDVKERAENIIKACGGNSIGVYTESTGLEIVKRHVAQYIKKRDGFPADYSNIMLTTGATEGIKNVFRLMSYSANGKRPGVMIPIPQYPLYSATIAENGMQQINYYLDEDNAWALSIAELKRSLKESKNICQPKALVIINPGNPTGSVLTYENIQAIIKFAFEEKLLLIADEVYQDNVYVSGTQFHSFKKVLMEMGEPYKKMELVSLMSASKGYMGESGVRGGYVELVNFGLDVKKMLFKYASADGCPNVLGQATIYCIMNPPQKGEPSYDLFVKEKTAILKSLKERALMVENAFNRMKGIKCNAVAGAMYAFPRLTLPEKAIEKAKSLGQTPDFFYVMQLLENTGICFVPGSGFGQLPGTFHFRTTILPQPEKLKIMLKKFEEFHNKFLEEYK
ncbi:alanine aminotransferase 2-like isoform X2 [Argiope bruennichi]|nr:alanine aminotransferase 2-like isoform X2 [Argiope bruennichi]